MLHKRLISLTILALCAATLAAAREPGPPMPLAVAAQPIAAALNDFARQSGLHVVIGSKIAKGVTSTSVEGTLTADDALTRLLANTGLRYEYLDDRTIAVLSADSPAGEPTATLESADSARIRLAHATSAEASGSVDSADESRELTADELEVITITSTRMLISVGKTPTTLRETPQSVSIITRQRMEEQNMVTLEDALMEAPGLSVRGSSSGQQSFFSRGYFVETFQLDGVPAEFGPWTVLTPDLAMYDRVEVLRGADGLYSGAGSPSGTVNLVRKKPLGRFQTLASGLVGSDDQYRVEGDITGPLLDSGKLRGRLVGAYTDRGFFYDVADNQTTMAYGALSYDLTPTTVVTAGFHVQNADIVPYVYGLPRYEDGSDLDLPRSTFLNAAWNRHEYRNTTSHIEVEQRIGEDWVARVTGTNIDAHTDMKTGYSWGPVPLDPNIAGPYFEAYDSEFSDVQRGVEALLSGTVTLFGRTHDVQVGANWQRHNWDWRDDFLDTGGPAVDVFNFDPRGIPEPFTVLASYLRDGEQRQYGVFGKVRMRVADRLSVIAGGRLSWYDMAFNGGALRIEQNNEPTPFFATVFDLTPSWSAYASLARIFDPQSDLRTFSGDPLPPKFGTNVEVGLKGELMDGRLNTSFALFDLNETNRAQQDPLHTPAGSYYISVGKVRSKGADFELNGQVTPNWTVYGGYTYNTTEYLRDELLQGEPFDTTTPKHMGKLWTTYRLPGAAGRWSLGGGFTTQSRRYNVEYWNNDVTVSQPSFTVASAQVGWKISDTLQVAATVDNLFDEVYYESVGYSDSNNRYGAPRRFELTLRARY
jgi:outer membrane receptor for ferric coprogen and ferric-rhodotorulic acid